MKGLLIAASLLLVAPAAAQQPTTFPFMQEGKAREMFLSHVMLGCFELASARLRYHLRG